MSAGTIVNREWFTIETSPTGSLWSLALMGLCSINNTNVVEFRSSLITLGE